MKWWSESRKTYVALGEMPDMHLVNAYKKLLRREYQVPKAEDGVLGTVMRPLGITDEARLRSAFEAEFARRGVDVPVAA
jgi:hypothetical protein